MIAENDFTELAEARREFASISKSLLESYAALAERAEHVDRELCRANAELEAKVRELDHVTRDLEAVLAALPTGVVVRDASGAIVRTNPAAERILATAREDLLGAHGHPLLRGRGAKDGRREIARDGSRLVLSSRWSEIPAHGGSVEILDDETELASLTERLHALDKVAALGTLAGGVAHEIRNPLNAVAGFARLLAKELETGSKAQRWASLIVQGADEANSIVSSLLCVARPGRLQTEAIDPQELLRQAIQAAHGDGSAASRWRIDVRSSAPAYVGDRIKLRQAVRNLVANALDAQPDGGVVLVEHFVESNDVVVRVSDAGPGIPDHIRGRVTDPFFTTRAEGTGLGLALASTIAQAHGGRIEISPCTSSLGGAELSLRLPFSPVL